jgi:hypothetical protein
LHPLFRGFVLTFVSVLVARADRAAGPDDVLVEEEEFAPSERDALIIDEPLPLVALEAHGLSLADVLHAPSAAADELANRPIYRTIVSVLTSDLRELNARPTIGDVPTNLRAPNRPFDPAWLTSAHARFELVAVVNRIDRIFVDPKRCGEARLVYRLALRPDERPETRLPMTINIAFPQPRGDDGCAALARKWQALGTHGTLPVAAVVAMFRALPHFDRIEINLQNMHGPALRKNEDDHAEYLLRSFRVGSDDAIVAGPLLNTPRADLDARGRAALGSWIQQNFQAIDDGTAVLPDELSATRIVSVTPRGLARPRNRPFTAQLGEPEAREMIAKLPFEKTSLIKSPAALLRRLDELTCPGCHQSRAVAGFHLLGAERNAQSSFNALEVGTSPHLEGDLAWRAGFLERAARGEAFVVARPFAERTIAGGGYGAHCGTGDPGFSDWKCDAGFSCRNINHDEIGICVPDGPRRPGDACQDVTLTATETADGDRVSPEHSDTCTPFDEDDPRTTSCSPNSFGFTGGFCSDACTELGATRGETICADLPISGFESDCFPSSRPIEVCLAEHAVRRVARSCDRSRPCRDDFGCARVAGAPPGIGVCIPPYFVLQARVDGPKLDR